MFFSDRLRKLSLLRSWKSAMVWAPLALGLSLGLRPGICRADDPPADQPPAAQQNSDDLPKPEELDRNISDGLTMKVTYFPGTKGQESIPVILLHGFKGSRKDFFEDDGLASILQKQLGCFVIVPDLRGHGDSTKVAGLPKPLNPKTMKPAEYSRMIPDLRTLKDFLWKKHNEKALNMNKLAVVGVDMGAMVGLGYAIDDSCGYEWGKPKIGGLQLGKFVKAIVFVSPNTTVKGLDLPLIKREALKVDSDVFERLSVMTVFGNKDIPRAKEAKTLYDLFEKARAPETSPDLDIKKRTLFFFPKIDTKLQGAKLLTEPSLELPRKITDFLRWRLVEYPKTKEKWGWSELKKPYE
jgi:pimeloyl-ACP methyl ester carboxylesterase